jgi:glutamine amidotransferase
VIALVDYGAGNLTSVRKALTVLGAEFDTPRAPVDLEGATGIIVPGVGHFDATRAIDDEWRGGIRAAIDRGAAVLGICLGMQWLFEGSDEAPCLSGLGIFRGNCVHLRGEGTQNLKIDPTLFKVPHVGWNRVALPRASGLMRNVPPRSHVYFTHSYAAPVGPECAAVTTYGMEFAAAVERDRVAGVQFHPEKSGEIGLQILRNWVDLTR